MHSLQPTMLMKMISTNPFGRLFSFEAKYSSMIELHLEGIIKNPLQKNGKKLNEGRRSNELIIHCIQSNLV